jgi:hypothetical protein
MWEGNQQAAQIQMLYILFKYYMHQNKVVNMHISIQNFNFNLKATNMQTLDDDSTTGSHNTVLWKLSCLGVILRHIKTNQAEDMKNQANMKWCEDM